MTVFQWLRRWWNCTDRLAESAELRLAQRDVIDALAAGRERTSMLTRRLQEIEHAATRRAEPRT